VINSLAHAPKIKGAPSRNCEKLHGRWGGQDITYENAVDRRVGVGAIVAARPSAQEGAGERG
jgi:hypothetical protein